MRRLFSALLAAAAVLAFSASPASAFNTGEQPPGPPLASGGGGTGQGGGFGVAIHCNSEVLGGDRGVIVVNKNKFDPNNCFGQF